MSKSIRLLVSFLIVYRLPLPYTCNTYAIPRNKVADFIAGIFNVHDNHSPLPMFSSFSCFMSIGDRWVDLCWTFLVYTRDVAKCIRGRSYLFSGKLYSKSNNNIICCAGKVSKKIRVSRWRSYTISLGLDVLLIIVV